MPNFDPTLLTAANPFARVPIVNYNRSVYSDDTIKAWNKRILELQALAKTLHQFTDAEILAMPALELVQFYYSLMNLDPKKCGVLIKNPVSAGLTNDEALQYELWLQYRIFNLRTDIRQIKNAKGQLQTILVHPRNLLAECKEKNLVVDIAAGVGMAFLGAASLGAAAMATAVTTLAELSNLRDNVDQAKRAQELVTTVQSGVTTLALSPLSQPNPVSVMLAGSNGKYGNNGGNVSSSPMPGISSLLVPILVGYLVLS